MRLGLLTILAIFLFPFVSFGDESNASKAQNAAAPPSFLKNFKSSFTWVAYNLNNDMLVSDTNNRDGFNKLKIDNSLSVGYKVSSDFSITGGQTFQQLIDTNPDNPELKALDPYISAGLNNIVKTNSGFKLGAVVRYYMPFSRATAQARDKIAATEAGRGTFRVTINPVQSIGSSFTFNPAVLYYYRMATHNDAERIKANGKPDHFDQRLYFDPSLSYSLTPKVDVYVEFDAIIEHYTNSNYWTPARANSDIYLGLVWTPVKKLVINPALYWSAAETKALDGTKSYKLVRGIDYTQVLLQVIYTFL